MSTCGGIDCSQQLSQADVRTVRAFEPRAKTLEQAPALVLSKVLLGHVVGGQIACRQCSPVARRVRAAVNVMRETERVADSLYLIAHDPATGRARLGPRQLGLGLAAALLGELVLGGLVELVDGAVWVSDRQPYLRRVRHYSGGLSIMGWCVDSHRAVSQDRAATPCYWCGVTGAEVFPDQLVWETRQLIARERSPRQLLDWLTVLAADAPALVAQRLAENEWLVAEDRRSFWSGQVRRTWVPANVVDADGPRQTLRRLALSLDPHPGLSQCLLVGLVDAVHLTRLVIADVPDPAAATQVLNNTAARLDGPLRQLVEQTKAAADNAVMTHTG